MQIGWNNHRKYWTKRYKLYERYFSENLKNPHYLTYYKENDRAYPYQPPTSYRIGIRNTDLRSGSGTVKITSKNEKKNWYFKLGRQLNIFLKAWWFSHEPGSPNGNQGVYKKLPYLFISSLCETLHKASVIFCSWFCKKNHSIYCNPFLY